MFSRGTRDPHLQKTIYTDRFEMLNCNWFEYVKLTYPWTKDPEILEAFTYDRSSYSLPIWALMSRIPNGRSFFVHKIRPKGGTAVVGVHIIYLYRSGTVSLSMGLTDQNWAGKGVFEEARAGLMDHFSESPKVVRFAGKALARNMGSVYIYKKLGFRLVGCERQSWLSPRTGDLKDIVGFEYLAADWRMDRNLGSS